MCIMSMVIDYGRERIWPQIPPATWPSPVPSTPPVDHEAELAKWEAFKKLLDKAKELDIVAAQPDCEDPEKVKWLKEMDHRMKAIEEKLGIVNDPDYWT